MSPSVRTILFSTLAGVAIIACDGQSTGVLDLSGTTIAITGGNSQSDTVGAALTTPLAVTVKDKSGNPVSGAVVTFTQDNGGTLASMQVTTDADGVAEDSFSLGTTAGGEAVTATVAGAETGVQFTFVAKAGNPVQLLPVGGDGQTGTAGAALQNPLIVMAEDRNGNPVPDVGITWSASAGQFQDPATDTSDDSGQASEQLQLPGSTGTVMVTAVLSSNTSVKYTFTEVVQ